MCARSTLDWSQSEIFLVNTLMHCINFFNALINALLTHRVPLRESKG